jgi:hypothetical protein
VRWQGLPPQPLLLTTHRGTEPLALWLGAFLIHQTRCKQIRAREFALAWKGNIMSDKVARVNLGVVSAAWWGGQAARGVVMIGRNADERQAGSTACSRRLVTRSLPMSGGLTCERYCNMMYVASGQCMSKLKNHIRR